MSSPAAYWSAAFFFIFFYIHIHTYIYIALHEQSNRLFVGGIFESAGQVFASIQALAVYNLKTMAWSRLGHGISGPNPVVPCIFFYFFN
jgi:hypothetical protein